MLISIKNDTLTVGVESFGAELRSMTDSAGTEYIWQRDEKYWGDSAPVLFPFVGRLTEGAYKYEGRQYPMTIHGFASHKDFAVAEKTDSSVTLELRSGAETLKIYPFDFILRISYALEGAKLNIKFNVENTSPYTMHFGIGGHPGFNVPFTAGETFEDYELVFAENTIPDRVGFTQDVYLNGEAKPLQLEEGRKIALRHDLFDEDAVVLQNMCKRVSLHSTISDKKLTVSYPGLNYLGIWHRPFTDAPYVCIEPWSSLPSRSGVMEDFACKSDLIHLKAGEIYETLWSIEIE